jgi:S1-C subfamily serine protease
MSHQLHNSLVRILTADGDPVGVGFLAADNLILTCAHVIAQASGQDENINLDLPMLAPGETFSGRILYQDAEEDIACVEISDLPQNAQPAPLIKADDLWGHAFRAFGFPAGFENGVWASGRILDLEATGWLQIEDIKNTGYFVQPGFSGGPVWDERLGGVIGMTVAADTRAGIRSAFILPVEKLLNAWAPLKAVIREIHAPTDNSPAPGESPYKGLQYFDAEDAALFYGREALTDSLLTHIKSNQFLAVVGASGSGKSSVVRAGVVAAVQSDPNWRIHIVTPTTNPLETLALSLTRDSESVTAAKTLRDDMRSDPESLHLYARRLLPDDSKAHLLLVVDQFEELFTLCRDTEEKEAYINNLMSAVAAERGGPVHVILTLRADFYHHCMAYQPLLQALEQDQKNIGAMSVDELQQAIEAPAKEAGWQFEPGLIDLMLRDVSNEPGALPLLSHALLATWQRRRGRTLTLAGYSDAGGVHGAIAKTAESTYQALGAKEKLIARNIFLRLTELGEGTQDTRRRASLQELKPHAGNQTETEHVLHLLADARLIITAKESAEVAHEALIREWPTLRLWLDENREALRIHRHLTETAQSWDARGRDPDELYRGARLTGAEDWAKGNAVALSPLEKEFLHTSQAEYARERRRTRLRWGSLAAAALLVFVTITLALTGQLNPLIYRPVDMDGDKYWVPISGGEFMMGSETGDSDESPVHKVRLDDFEIGKYEVTNRQYAQCVRADICDKPSSSEYNNEVYALHPVTDVNWDDAQTFCEYVGGRLPTEAEWEYAARGGLAGKDYPWEDEVINCEHANFSGCVGGTSTVGDYPANKYGLYDMAGNVWEWTSSLYASYPYDPNDGRENPDSTDSRILRGGSWYNAGDILRVSGRNWNFPDLRYVISGFRCSR